MLSQGEPRGDAENFDTQRFLCHSTADLYTSASSDRSSTEISHSTLIFTAVTQIHGDS